jgi:C-terminal processing protease CtpA/Prc
MYGGIDCHTAYFPPQLFARLFAADNGQPTAGTGLQFAGIRGAPFVVARIVPGSPADQAGVHPGDQVVGINHLTFQ